MTKKSWIFRPLASGFWIKVTIGSWKSYGGGSRKFRPETEKNGFFSIEVAPKVSDLELELCEGWENVQY